MSENLYNFLSEQGDYTKSYEDFQTQFANQDSIQSLHNFMTEKGDYTKSLDDFNTQFFSGDQENSSVIVDTSPLQTALQTQDKITAFAIDK